MKFTRRTCAGFRHAASRTAVAVSLAISAPHAFAQDASSEAQAKPESEPAKPKPKPPPRALRVSDWLLQQKPPPNAYPLGVSWRLPEEVPAQMGLKLDILAALSGEDRTVKADRAALKRLRDWFVLLPVTGRVPLASGDGRWLQVNPSHDPLLRPGHTVVVPARPRTVTVVVSDGRRCSVVHVAGHEAKAYVDACRSPGIGRADWAWIAQPDGTVQRFGIAAWNEEKQDEPAAGAWIWAPARLSGWPDKFSDRLVRFLATQGPAPDPSAAEESTPANAAHAPLMAGGQSRGFSAEIVDDGARGATGGAGEGEGFQLGGGMSLGLSESLLPTQSPQKPDAPRPREEPLILRDEERAPRARSPQVSSSDWGSVGLLQTPTSRMREAGHLSFHWDRVKPYTHGNVVFQPFDWMEAGFRYTDVSNRLYGGPNDQTFKDKSIDVKFRAWKESAYLPEVALGLRDVGGTGLFAGEYVVANKRTWDLDWSLGVGWGYVGARRDVRNPLHVFSSRFDTRGATGGLQGGVFSLGSYFTGPAAVFGGVQYQTPWSPLSVKVEYEGNNYKQEPLNNSFEQKSPVNFGLVYKAWKGIDLSLGYERGNTLMFGVTIYSNLAKLSQPKLSDPKPVPVADARPARQPDWSATARDFKTQTDWSVRTIEQRDSDVRVVVEDATAFYWRERIDRGAAVLHRDAPANVDRFTLAYRYGGVDLAEHVIDREAWVSDRTRPLPPSEQRVAVMAREPEPPSRSDVVHLDSGSKTFEHGLRLRFAETIGGPDAFVLWQLGLMETARLRLREDTWVQGSVRLRLVDNYDKFTITGPSDLPRVRTYLREYLTTSNVTMPNLQLVHIGRAGDNHYYSAYGGYLEEMFAGVGGEWLYRPFGSRFAFGVDVNSVRQREFEQGFGFKEYKTVTGHGTMYWDTGWNDVLATVHVGKYLARDIGATLQLTRVFKNGVTVGAFATRTNVSAAEFGEGSFDKGVFVTVPFDALFTRTSRSFMTTLWRPLTRDGGAMLGRGVNLYAITGPRSDRTLWFAPPPPANERVNVADQRVAYTPPAAGPQPYTRVTPKPPAARWERTHSLDELRLTEALYAQSFRNIRITYDTTQRLIVSASNEELRPISRAVGRAARTALLHAPLEARGVEVTLLHGAAPQVRYEFFEVDRLQRYFDRRIPVEELKPFVKVEWINPAAVQRDPFERLDDLDPEARPRVLSAVVPDTLSVNRVANDLVGAGHAAAKVDWFRAGTLGAGLVLSSSLLDKSANRFAEKHAGSSWLTNGVKVGNAIPWLAIGGAGLAAIDGSDPRRSRTGYAALEAGATSLAVAQGLKYAVGRARPRTGLSRTTFKGGTNNDDYWSFPSIHTVAAWSVVTPFALEYDMPWLYGAAAVANLSRIGSREHWVSDTVASSLIGYGLGRIFWQSSKEQAKGEPKVYFDGSGMSMLWDW